MIYRAYDAKGNQVAQYQNKSEMETYIKASFPFARLDAFNLDNPGGTDVKDADGKIHGRIDVVAT